VVSLSRYQEAVHKHLEMNNPNLSLRVASRKSPQEATAMVRIHNKLLVKVSFPSSDVVSCLVLIAFKSKK
jgi:ATP/maltotriose-dependent transcriptional regulator MalT